MSAIELWRGAVNSWECDEMGHMNVRFYLARAWEGLAVLCARMGLIDAFRPGAAATVRVLEHRVRYLAEAHEGALLHMTGGLTALRDDEAEAVQVLWHSEREQVCATVLTRFAHVTPREDKPFAWSSRARAAAGALTFQPPAEARARGVGAEPVDLLSGSGERADALGLQRTALGLVQPADADVFGRLRPEALMGRLSDAATHLFGRWEAHAKAHGDARRLGRVMLEGRMAFGPDSARIGDLVELRSGLSRIDDKVETRVDWALDPVTGRPWAALEAVVASFDLDARRLAPYGEATRAAMRQAVVPGLGL
jgi:acyl-CoA thioester hydrolase